MERIRQCFAEAHQRLYGHGDINSPMELVVVRCRSVGRIRKPVTGAWHGGVLELKRRSSRKVFHTGRHDFLDSAIYERDDIAAGISLDGPAVIEEWSTSILIPPGWRAKADNFGNILVNRN